MARPACRLRRRSRSQTDCALRRVPPRPMNRAAVVAAPAAPRSAQPGLQRLDRLAPDRHGAALAALAQHVRLAGLQVDPAARRAARRGVQADQLADAQAAAVQQFHDRGVARLEPADRPRRPGSRPAAPRRRRPAPWAAGLRRLGRAHVLHRIAGHQALAAEPGVEAAPAGQDQRDAAAAAARAMHLRDPAAHVRGLHARERHAAPPARWRSSFCRSSAYSSTVRAPGAFRRARARGSARPGPRRRPCVHCVAQARQRGATPVRRCARGSRCPCRRAKRCGSGEASTSMPKAGDGVVQRRRRAAGSARSTWPWPCRPAS